MANEKGLTLIELLVTISILAILTTIGIPSFTESIANKRLSSGANDFIASLQLAKSNALSSNSVVTMCTKLSNENKCKANGEWQNGWLVFIDKNGDKQRDNDETILNIHQSLNSSISLNTTDELKNAINFRPNGMLNISSTQSVVICDARGFGPHAKAILVPVSGRGSVVNVSDLNRTSCS